jgi:hypothetical protein
MILQIESSTLHLHMTTVLAGIGFWLWLEAGGEHGSTKGI